ncbi:MAG: NYN domain-containing protein [bacterium]
MTRVAFLVDGFNLYHSIVKLQRDTNYCANWLDVYSLCNSYLHLFGKETQLTTVRYFSALPYHLNSTSPGKIDRHQKYLSCLKDSEVIVELGRFKEKDVFCTKCRTVFLKHEEKETDVAIAITLLELLFTGKCDTAVIMSGDTDLSPAVKKSRALFPDKKILFAFPYARKNKELHNLATDSFSISQKQYIRHQFSNPVILKNGHEIHKPSTW